MSKTAAAIKRHRTAKLASLLTRAYVLKRRGKEDQMYTMICDEFVELGGVYIKFLQGVLLRSQVMRRWRSRDKLRIFENLDSEPLDISAFLQAELPAQKLARIQLIQPQPFAAGSFGQVYYGQLDDGRQIIVKVLRPMIRELLRYDLRLLSAFSRRFFIKLYKNMDIQLDQALKDFRDATLRETDYRHEAAFAHELYEAYKDSQHLVIPETLIDLCTDNVIVQEYIGGISVAQLVRLKEQGVDPVAYVKETIGSNLDKQLEEFGYESIMGIFTMPRVQGDPHPGNIRLLPDDKIGLIDFGISARSPEEKAAFFGMLESYDKIFKGSQGALDMFEQLLRFFVSDLYHSLNAIGKFMGNGNIREKYSREVSKIAEESFVQATGTPLVLADFKDDQSVLVIVNKLINKGNRFGLVMKLESTEILRATQTYTTLVGTLGRYQQVIPRIMDRVITDAKAKYPELVTDNDKQVSISEALETVSHWLERVADRDPLLFQQLSRKIRMSREDLATEKGAST